MNRVKCKKCGRMKVVDNPEFREMSEGQPCRRCREQAEQQPKDA